MNRSFRRARHMRVVATAIMLATAATQGRSDHQQGAVPIGDAEAGAAVFAEDCAACHQIGKGATYQVGPQLTGIFDRPAGAIEGFDYSPALQRMGADGLIWQLETLDAFLANPVAMVSDTAMIFDGIADAPRRQDLLAFLRAHSAQPGDIPESAPTAKAILFELPPETAALVGDPEYGEYLAQECATCHQGDGSAEGIPAITGWPAPNFMAAMHAYKVKLRPHPVMQMMAGRLDDEQIAALAAYYEQIGE